MSEQRNHPKVTIVEEGMREGMQIESADIPVADKIRLLDALSATGLKNIVVGSFVSPKWVPQMAARGGSRRRFHACRGSELHGPGTQRQGGGTA